MWLSKKQRNELLIAVVQAGVPANELDLEVQASGRHVIKHIPSESNFWLDPTSIPRNGPYYLGWHVGTDPMQTQQARGWDAALQWVNHWARYTKEYVDTPDLWIQLRSQPELLAEIGDKATENSAFTYRESLEIAAQLRAIKDRLGTAFSLSNEQVEQIGERLDEAAEASKRMGRKDWLLLFSGTIFTLIVTDIVTPAVADHIFTMVIHSLGYLFTGGSEPPRLPG